jgi:hypothetical protein
MENRLRWLQGATLLLYLGPLLAGVAGHGLGVIPAYTGIFLLRLIIMQPRDWPRTAAAWGRSDTWVAAAARVVVQLLIVLISFGIGRGLAGVAGLRPSLDVMLPLFISFLAIPVSRLIWDPSDPVRVAKVLGGITGDPTHDDRATADALTAPLADLAPDTPLEVLENHLSAMALHVPPRALMQSLMTRAEPASAPLPVKRAFMLRATDPGVADAARPISAPAAALKVARTRPDLLSLYAPRALALITAHPGLWPGFPGSGDLRDAAQGADGASATALIALADALDRLSPDNPLE